MIKKTLPILIGCIAGLYAFIEFYIPHYHVKETTKEILDYAAILGAAAFVLGAINVFQVSLPKIRRKEADWHYKLLMLIAAGVVLLSGITWHTPKNDLKVAQLTTDAKELPPGKAKIVIDAPEYVGARVAGYGAQPARITEIRQENGELTKLDTPRPAEFIVDAGSHEIVFYRREAGYSQPSAKIKLAAGEQFRVSGAPSMLWGKDGRVKTWFYDYIFYPCNATMFALLAFFVVSAAFRAFRARNVEAALLLGSAILILLGRAPLGQLLGDFPDIAQWIIDIPNNAGRRAIMMGAAIGGIATGLRIILGLERSHLGAD